MKNAWFLSDFDAHPYTGNVFFLYFFSFFFDVKVVRDDSGLYPTDSDFGTDFFCKKVCSFLFMKKLVNAKIRGNAFIFCDFLYFSVKKLKKWKNTSPGYFAVRTHKNWGVWRGVEIAFHGCRRVFKRGDRGWNCPCCFLLLYNFQFLAFWIFSVEFRFIY